MDNQVTVATSERWENTGFVSRKVIVGEPSTGCIHDRIRNTTAVKAFAAILGDVFQCFGQLRLPDDVPEADI